MCRELKFISVKAVISVPLATLYSCVEFAVYISSVGNFDSLATVLFMPLFVLGKTMVSVFLLNLISCLVCIC